MFCELLARDGVWRGRPGGGALPPFIFSAGASPIPGVWVTGASRVGASLLVLRVSRSEVSILAWEVRVKSSKSDRGQ